MPASMMVQAYKGRFHMRALRFTKRFMGILKVLMRRCERVGDRLFIFEALLIATYLIAIVVVPPYALFLFLAEMINKAAVKLKIWWFR